MSRLVNPETRRDAARTNIPETAVAGVAPAAPIATRPDARSEKCAKRRFPRRFEDARADDREVLVRTTAPKTLPEAVAALARDINQRMRSRSRRVRLNVSRADVAFLKLAANNENTIRASFGFVTRAFF